MTRRRSITWKLTTAVIAIVLVTLLGAVAILVPNNNRALFDTTQKVLRFQSRTTIDGFESVMMTHSTTGVESYFQDVSRHTGFFRDLNLIAHERGEIVASLGDSEGTVLGLDARGCVECHALEDPREAGLGQPAELLEHEGGGRTLSIITPIRNKTGCRNADCHVHESASEILGFLQADYSLDALDKIVNKGRNYSLAVVAFAALFSALLLTFLLRRGLERPIRGLIHGTRRLAEGDREFRFPAERNDEVGELEDAFNSLSNSVQAHEAKLYEAWEHLEGIVEYSADIIITVSLEHRILSFNAGAESALGYGRDEILGQRMRTLFARPEDRDEALKILESSDNVQNFSTQFKTKTGELRDVLLTLSRLRDREGKTIGTFGISKDITEEKRLLRQLIQSKKLIAIGQAVTGIQHATKNMLSALKGGAYLVRSGMKNDNKERLADGWAMVEDGIERISGLSKNMLNYARDWTPTIEACAIREVLVDVVDSLTARAQERDVVIRTTGSEGLPDMRCDPKLIRTAVMDIATNAIDACYSKEYAGAETPEVLLQAYTQDDSKVLVIEISDNGCGMDQETIQRVFEPFFSTKEEWGTGIGLAMTTRVIEVHGGQCHVESEVGEGSTFRVTLPVGGPH